MKIIFAQTSNGVKHINYYFLGLSVLLVGLGLIFLSTLSAIASMKAFGNTNYYLFRQVVSAIIGLILACLVFIIPIHTLKKVIPILLAIILIVSFAVPLIGQEFWGATRWISIGGKTLQPSEFLKVAAILYVSALISSRFSENLKNSWSFSIKKAYDNVIKVFLPFLLLLFVIALILYWQKNLSTLGIIGVTLITIYFLSGTPLWHTIVTLSMLVITSVTLIITEPYRLQRVLTFLRPEADPLGAGLQVKQSLIALGSGGFFGNGLGMSTQKFGFLPQAMSDSVFAIIGEETGIIGTSVLIILFLAFLYFGIKIAKSADNKFAKLTAIGITTWITFQAFLNISANIGLFPLGGIPLPFFSYGGSHLIAEIVGLGLLLKISKS